jgi:small subunit ribosomal protein S4
MTGAGRRSRAEFKGGILARYTGPVCRLCRREGVKLFLKGDRCFTKCPIDSQNGTLPPGQHGARRTKITEYGKRLREKQKLRRVTGLMERQFYRYFTEAQKTPGSTGETFLRLLETRLDNVVRRLGFSASLAGARQTVLHGHVTVNGRRVSIPSQGLEAGDRVELVGKMKNSPAVQKAVKAVIARGLPSWLEWEEQASELLGRSQDPVDLTSMPLAGKVKSMPGREEMSFPVNEQLIIELYSK